MSRRGCRSSKPKAISLYLPFELWPETDQSLWRKARNDDFLEEGGLGKAWRPATAAKYVRDYGRWLAWLRRVEPSALKENPLERLTKERVKSYVVHLKATVAPVSVASLLRGIGSVAWVFSESDDFYWITRYAMRLAYRAVPVKNKRQLIQPTHKLVALGEKLMENARTQPLRYSSAIQYRNGLLIALLAYRPIRRGNISAIVIGQHLNKRDGAYALSFGEHETKQRKLLDVPIPESLTRRLDIYIETYRPVLLARPAFAGTAGNALWVANDGGPLWHWGVYAMVRTVTRREFGYPLNPHIFRDCAATTVALEHPDRIEIVENVLGHSNPLTAARHYNQARCIDASRRFQDHLKEMSRERRSFSGKKARNSRASLPFAGS